MERSPVSDTHSALLDSLDRAARDVRGQRAADDMDRALADLVSGAMRAVPNADGAGVTVSENSTITSRHPSSASVFVLDRLQAEHHEGPCVTAAERPAGDGMVYARDLRTRDSRGRWPRFAPAADDHGYRSMLSTHLTSAPGFHAALNLYSRAPDAFDESARTLAALFALQASALLYGTQHASHLKVAVETRDVIGRAKDILQERFHVDDDQAFHMLVRSSQDTTMGLVTAARWLVEHRGWTRQDPPAAGGANETCST